MKITGYAVPQGMEQIAGRVITPSKNQQGTVTGATQRKGSKKSPARKKQHLPQNDLTEALQALAEQLGYGTNTPKARHFVAEQKADITAGNWNPLYWIELDQTAVAYLEAQPVSVPDPSPPPYDYRDQSNLPTLPAYTDGAPASAPASYYGETQNNQFRDLSLCWARYTYDLAPPNKTHGTYYVFSSVIGDMTVQASHRGSKPMLSLLSAYAIVAPGSPALSSTVPITQGIATNQQAQSRMVQSHYWRYRLPPSNPPYFSTVRLRPIIRNVTRCAAIESTGNLRYVVMCLSPRPMFGRGYNNNTSVRTSYAGAVRLFQLLADPVPCTLVRDTSVQQWSSEWYTRRHADAFIRYHIEYTAPPNPYWGVMGWKTELYLWGRAFVLSEVYTEGVGIGGTINYDARTVCYMETMHPRITENGRAFEWETFSIPLSIEAPAFPSLITVTRWQLRKDGKDKILSQRQELINDIVPWADPVGFLIRSTP